MPDHSVDVITMESTPIAPGTGAELARVIKPGGQIILAHAGSTSYHQSVVTSVTKIYPDSSVTSGSYGDVSVTAIIVR